MSNKINPPKEGQDETSENNLFEVLSLRHQILENPESAEAHCDLGVAMMRNDDSENAIRYLKQATELNPKHDRSFFNLGRCYQSIGYIDNAINAYDRVIQLNPEDHQAWTNLAALFLQRNEAEEAIRLYQKAVSLAPHVHETWVDLGTTQFLLGLYEEAIDALNKAADLNDSNYQCWQQLGLCHYALKQTEQSINGFKKALAINPDCHSTCNNLGNSYLQNQQPNLAETSYRKAIDLNPDIVDYWFNLGELLFNLNRRDESIACFSRVYQQNPDDQEALDYLVESTLEVAPSEALPYLKKLIKIRGESPLLLAKLGGLYQKIGNIEMEAKTRLKLSTNNPLDAENNLRLAKLTLEKGNTELAYSFLKGGHNAATKDDLLWFRFSQSFRIKNNPEEELNCLTAVVKTNPEHLLAWERLGEIALSKEMPSKAYQYFEKALPVLKNKYDLWIHLTENLLEVKEFDLAVLSSFHLIPLNLHTPEKWDRIFLLFKERDEAERFCQVFSQKLLSESIDPKLAATFAKQILESSTEEIAETFLRNLGTKWPGVLEILQEQVEFLLNTNQTERAELLTKSVLSEHPDNYHFLIYLAQVASQQQHLTEALESLRKAKEVKPGHYLSWLLIAKMMFEQGEDENALEELERSLSLHPDNSEAHRLRGTILLKKNDVKEATLCYRKALSLNRKDPLSWQKLALIDQETGKTETAKTKLLRSLVCNKSFLPAWQDLADLYKQMGDKNREKSCLEKIEELNSPK